jgi:hypothetical protein
MKRILLIIMFLTIAATCFAKMMDFNRLPSMGDGMDVGGRLSIMKKSIAENTYWASARTEYWETARTDFWLLPRNTEIPE